MMLYFLLYTKPHAYKGAIRSFPYSTGHVNVVPCSGPNAIIAKLKGAKLYYKGQFSDSVSTFVKSRVMDAFYADFGNLVPEGVLI